MFAQLLGQPLLADVRVVLGGDNDGVQRDGGIALVDEGDLGLAVRAQVRDDALLAHLAEPERQAVGGGNRKRHVLGGFVRCVAEHQALVACAGAVLVLGLAAGAHLLGGIHAVADLLGLLADGDVDATGLAVEADVGGVKPNIGENAAHQVGNLHVCLGADLAHHVDLARGGQRFHRHAGVGILGEECVQNRVRNGVTNLVRMPLGHGLGGKEANRRGILSSHV